VLLAAGLKSGVRAILLNLRRDALAQIADAVERHGIHEEIHLVVHDAPASADKTVSTNADAAERGNFPRFRRYRARARRANTPVRKPGRGLSVVMSLPMVTEAVASGMEQQTASTPHPLRCRRSG
jgi:hypothetical protein